MLILFMNKITTLLPLEFVTTIWSSISDIWFSGKAVSLSKTKDQHDRQRS